MNIRVNICYRIAASCTQYSSTGLHDYVLVVYTLPKLGITQQECNLCQYMIRKTVNLNEIACPISYQ